MAVSQIPGIMWEKKYGGTGADQLNDVLIHDDGTFVVVGASKSNDGHISGHHGSLDSNDAWIARLDADGNMLWQRSIGGANSDEFNAVIKGVDQSFICIGSTTSNDGDVSNNRGSSDLWVVKVNYDGTIAWSKTFGGSGHDWGFDGVVTSDQHYAIAGTTLSRNGDVASNTGDTSAWVIKISGNGSLVWEKCAPVTPSRSHGIELGENNDLMTYVSQRTQTLEGVWPYEHWVNHWPAKLYSVDNSNGTYQVASAVAGEYDNSFVKGDGEYFLAGSYHDYDYTEFCFRRRDFVWKKEFDSTRVMQLGNSYNGNYSCPAYVNFERYGPYHGIANNEDSYVVAGTYHQESIGSYGMLKYGNRDYIHDVDQGVFNSVKTFPSGNDFIIVGFTGNWRPYYPSNPEQAWIVRVKGHNRITGQVFLDENNNGIKDAGEPPFNYGKVKTTKQSSRWEVFPTDGTYAMFVDTGSYQTQYVPPSSYYTVSPAMETSVFNTFAQRDTINFAVRAENIIDKSVACVPLTDVRPGFEAGYKIVYTNRGTVSNSTDTIKLELDPRSSLLNATPQPLSSSGGVFTWHVPGLQPFESAEINIMLQLDAPPMLNAGDNISFTTRYIAGGDVDSTDNIFVLQQDVTGSYDPNDKNENYSGRMPVADLQNGQWLSYTIRFQNTGNDTAFNIIIRDTLTDRLNTDSIQFTGSSHPCTMSLKDGKFLSFNFANILLVDSIQNEPLSHGFVTFKIRPNRALLAMGDTILNGASIYFDFNLPIVTNEHQTIIVDNITPPDPVTLFDFAGTLSNGQVLLTWKTDNELSISGFEVEHSTDGLNFVAIGFVTSHGNSNDPQSYSYNHLNPSDGTNHYRVRARRANGWNLLSNEIIVDNPIINPPATTTTTLSPNPVKGTLNICLDVDEETRGGIRVIDMAGKIVYKRDILFLEGNNNVQIDCARWMGGVYQVVIVRDGKNEVIRFIKQ